MKTGKQENDEIRIRISGLSVGLHEYHFSVKPETLELDGSFQKAVEVDAQLDKTVRQLYLKTVIQTSGSFQCDRCLEDFEEPIKTGYNMFYVYDEVDTDRYDPEEVHVISGDTVSISLGEDIRQMILLSVPLKLLCQDDCKGLCPHCGTNLNRQTCDCKEESESDPRWHELKRLLKS
jgi:DUF177 domain-containing protein